MRRIGLAAVGCLLLAALTLLSCATEVNQRVTLMVASTTGGSVAEPGEGMFEYEVGAVVNLVAKPDAGYRFVNWTGNVSTIADVHDATTTIIMEDGCFIVANFVKQQYDLSASSTAGGSVLVPGEGTFTYDGGAVVRLVAQADKNYKFVGWTGDVGTISDVNAAQTTITMNGSYAIIANFRSKYTPMVAGGGLHTVGLRIDGTVVAVGYNEYAECIVDGWTDITQVLAGKYHTVGLKSDGTLIRAGWCPFQQCFFEDWTDIVQVAGSYYHTVGLKSDGTVVAVGLNDDGQCNVGGWTNIVQVAAGGYHTVGLKADGTVIVAGSNNSGQCDVAGWRGIVQVAAGAYHTVGLRSDGSAVSAGADWAGQCAVGGWKSIVQVTAGDGHTVGLRSDGTVVAVGSNSSGQCDVGRWNNVIHVSAGYSHTVALKRDGTVVAVGSDGWGQCRVSGWRLM